MRACDGYKEEEKLCGTVFLRVVRAWSNEYHVLTCFGVLGTVENTKESGFVLNELVGSGQ